MKTIRKGVDLCQNAEKKVSCGNFGFCCQNTSHHNGYCCK